MTVNRTASSALPRPALRWVAVLCGALVWVLSLLAASQQLHLSLHDDAGHADHVCAVTLFSHGTDNPEAATVFVAEPAITLLARVMPADPLRVESPADWLQPGRGPPAC